MLVGDFSNDGNTPSPAKAAGLEPGDVIVAIEGMPVDRVGALQRIVRTKKPGDVVSVDVMRFGDKKTFRVKLAEAPSDAPVAVADDVGARREKDASGSSVPVSISADKLGITVEPISAEFAREARVPASIKGVRVSQVDVGSGARGKLFDSDIITEIVYPRPRRAVRTPAELLSALNGLKAGDVITLGVFNVSNQSNRVETVRIGGE